MSRNIDLAPDEFYHVYNRGTDKRTVFLSNKDYERFVGLLYACNGDKSVDLKLQGSTLDEFIDSDRGNDAVDLCAYVLMPNHFHLLLRGKTAGDISKFMQKVSTGYTMYFNTRNDRSGALFQGRFKARHVHTDTYLAYLIAYIHLNPVKLIDPKWKEGGISDRERAEDFLRTYRWSSYQDYLGTKRKENALVSKDALPEYWSAQKSFETFVTDWLKHDVSQQLPQATAVQTKREESLV